MSDILFGAYHVHVGVFVTSLLTLLKTNMSLIKSL